MKLRTVMPVSSRKRRDKVRSETRAADAALRSVHVSSATSGQQHYLREVDGIVRSWAADVSEERADPADLDELAGRFHAAFPNYEMGFLTNYSIYALAAAALQSQ